MVCIRWRCRSRYWFLFSKKELHKTIKGESSCIRKNDSCYVPSNGKKAKRSLNQASNEINESATIKKSRMRLFYYSSSTLNRLNFSSRSSKISSMTFQSISYSSMPNLLRIGPILPAISSSNYNAFITTIFF